MPSTQRRVALSRAERETPTARELIAILAELTADGQVTRSEVARLREWLEITREVALPACGFLYEEIDQISADGEISESELDRVAAAIERVLPPEIRRDAAAQRRALRLERREAKAADRRLERVVALAERERTRPLHRADFLVVGVRFSEERREACEQLEVGELVTLEREPDNAHDANAILVMTANDCELGYVPREYANEMAPLLDAGAEAQARVKKLIESSQGRVIPVVVTAIYRAGALPFERTSSNYGEGSEEKVSAPAAAVPGAEYPPGSSAPRSGPRRALLLVAAALAALIAVRYVLG